MPNCCEEAARKRAGGDAGGGFAGTGAFEGFAAIGGEPFDAAGEIGMAGAGAMSGGVAVGSSSRESLLGISIVIGRADGFAHADAGEEFDVVGFDFLPSAASVAALAAAEFRVDEVNIDRHAGGHAFDERDQCPAVRFAGGSVGQHCHR